MPGAITAYFIKIPRIFFFYFVKSRRKAKIVFVIFIGGPEVVNELGGGLVVFIHVIFLLCGMQGRCL
ncbi:hypothetical protein D3C80_1898650 [compost metagenome]